MADLRIRAVGFTGSRAGETALMKIAAEQRQPIPVYAEMSSINPVLLFPYALKNRGSDIGNAFVASLTIGAGKFCTNPGHFLAVEGEGFNEFVATAAAALTQTRAQTTLTAGICKAYKMSTAKMGATEGILQD